MANKQVIKSWVEALESGKYKQTAGALHRVEPSDDSPVGYCCLGVLCDLAAKKGVVTTSIQGDFMGYESLLDPFPVTAVLPYAVVNWAGLDSPNPKVTTNNPSGIDGISHLATLNDYGLSFRKIAALIREEYLDA